MRPRDFLDMASGQVETKEEQPPAADSTDNDAQEGNDVAVAEPELLMKHPLQNKWALWYFKKTGNNSNWVDNLKLVTSVDTVEDFWGLYNHVQYASRLTPGCDYSLFKDGIRPMWEDDGNKNGGRWLINLDKRQRLTDLDNFWLETLLCLVGEAFDQHSQFLCGATVNIRNKIDKLGVWTSDATEQDATLQIGRKIKERLGLPLKFQIGYQVHTDTQTRSGSASAKNRFSV